MSSLDRFRALLRIPTVSRVDESLVEWSEFDAFVSSLPDLYPRLHASLQREAVGRSLVYRWTGASAAESSVLMGHYDVVATVEERWDHPPFDATLVGEGDDRVLWGRGTLDDKGAVVAILEAVERLVVTGFVPSHDVYLCFGHDEETHGAGARAIVDVLAGRGIRPSFVLDEGGAIVEGVFPGVSSPIAVVGVSEKGIASVDLTVLQRGGHASTPPRRSATTRLARAIIRLDARPFRSSWGPTQRDTIRTVGRHARQPYRWIFSNQWLTRGLLQRVFTRLGPETAAMVRTTAVVTTLAGSDAENALAESARATINLRVAVGSTLGEALAHIRRAIRDPAVTIEARGASEPSPVSPSTGPAWELLKASIAAVYPSAIVTPYVQLGASDSRHFTRISDHVYRFTPFEMSLEERGTLHAADERIRVDTWLRAIDVYEGILRGL